MALTTLLEKAILNGWAKFEINNFAFSNFGRIQIPKGSTVIITHIKWYPFFNPIEIKPEMRYKELFKYLDGEWTLDFAIEKIKQSTRIYSRKQITWFKRDKKIHWINLSETSEDYALKKIISISGY